jgi:hypothetical protein
MDKNPKHKESGLTKAYVSGLSASTAKARAAHWKKTSKMDPKNPAAYEPAPGDATAKTKLSKHTKAYRAKFGEETVMDDITIDEAAETGLAKKAKASGISIGTLRKVYKRGVAAWRTGHRPGTTPQQWAMARVNSYITKGKGTYHGADKDLREGLWANIHAKRKRGERMRKPGEKGAPTAAALKAAQAAESFEKHTTDMNKPSSRFDGSDELVANYKAATPGQSSTLKTVKKVVREALGDCGCGGNCKCGDTKNIDEKKEFQNPTGGLSRRGREHYNRTTGSNLKAPVTTKPSKLKKGTRAHSRRKSFCARMGGMKKRLTSAKTARDPDSRINKALRKWNC